MKSPARTAPRDHKPHTTVEYRCCDRSTLREFGFDVCPRCHRGKRGTPQLRRSLTCEACGRVFHRAFWSELCRCGAQGSQTIELTKALRAMRRVHRSRRHGDDGHALGAVPWQE